MIKRGDKMGAGWRLRWAGVMLVMAAAWSAARAGEPTACVLSSPTLLGSVEGSLVVGKPQGLVLTRHTKISGRLLLAGTPVVELDEGRDPAKMMEGRGEKEPSGYPVAVREGAVVAGIVSRAIFPEGLGTVEPEAHLHFRRLLVGDGKVVVEARKEGRMPPSARGGRYEVKEYGPGKHPAFVVEAGGNVRFAPVEGVKTVVIWIDELEVKQGKRLLGTQPTVLHVRNYAAVDGELGDREKPDQLWVTGDRTDVIIQGGGMLAGTLYLPRGALILSGKGRMTGGLCVEHLVMAPGSELRLALPGWKPEGVSWDGEAKP